ncbi:hypothetical protein AB1N83_008678 [Pleurotus pulmonarius]
MARCTASMEPWRILPRSSLSWQPQTLLDVNYGRLSAKLLASSGARPRPSEPRGNSSHEGSHATNRDMNVARRSRSLVLASTSYALFSIPIAVTLKLDGRPPEVVDLQTTVVLNIYESEASAARWGATGLDNVSHSLVVTYGKPLNNTRGPAPYTIVDGFIYTVEDETSTAGTDGNASKSSSTPLIAGHVGGLGSASLIAGISLFVLWRRE